MVALINTTLMRALAAVAGLKTRLAEEHGQDLIEYAMLSGLIAAGIAAVITAGLLTGAIDLMIGGIGDCIDFNSGSACP